MRFRVKRSQLKIDRRFIKFEALLLALVIALAFATSRTQADTGTCGGQSIILPFTDVMGNGLFCQIAAAYFSGLTNGTTATTYSPGATVTRDQMAAFVSRTLDQSLKRGSRRAALDQLWTLTPPYAVSNSLGSNFGTTTVIPTPIYVRSNGENLYVVSDEGTTTGRITEVRASDGLLLRAWVPPASERPFALVVALGRVFYATGGHSPGLFSINLQSSSTSFEGAFPTTGNGIPRGMVFDGAKIWITYHPEGSGQGSVNNLNIITGAEGESIASISQPVGILYDGANIWVTDRGDNKLKKLNSTGGVIQSVSVGVNPQFPAFDGANIWVPNLASNSVTVVRAATGTVLATLTSNGLNGPTTAAFDGERILVTNNTGSSVSLWKATDLTPLGSFSTGAGTNPTGACSDGLNFWITLSGVNNLARF